MTSSGDNIEASADNSREILLLVGAGGQLGQTLLQTLDSQRYDIRPLTRQDADIADEAAIGQVLDTIKPAVIVNAAAYTAVDKAESDDLTARAANATGPKLLARWAAANQAWLLQISTDFVFNGHQHRPYTPDDQTDPPGIYGRTKLEGELHVGYLAPKHSLILRTSWVYSEFGHNFVKTMLKLMQTKDKLGIVADQIGTPSSTWEIARCINRLLTVRPTGILHWSDAGVASWYDFAIAIQEEACQAGLLASEIPVNAIATTDYPTPAKRPPYSVLDKSATIAALDCQPIHWRRALRQVISRMANSEGR